MACELDGFQCKLCLDEFICNVKCYHIIVPLFRRVGSPNAMS